MRDVCAKSLLKEAAVLFDGGGTKLRASAARAWRRRFVGGGEWMREALWVLRKGGVTFHPFDFHQLGLIKYGAASLGAACVIGLSIFWRQPWLAISALLVFYLVEVQMLFVFPLAIDRETNLLSASRRLVSRSGGTWKALCIVVQLAMAMLFGGLAGRGFVRSWCLGCLAVLVWYERLRTQDTSVNVVSTEVGKLQIGNSHPLMVRCERFNLWNNPEPLRIAYISDLHLRSSSAPLVDEIVDTVRQQSPDLVLLGGDLVDTRSALPLLERFVASVHSFARVWAIPGNHDELVGINSVRNSVEQSGGHWLGNSSVLLRWPRRVPFYLDGQVRREGSGLGRILCLHDPVHFPEAAAKNYSLVLAGHLHGGQVVLGQTDGRLYPGALFYKWNGLKFVDGDSVMLVSRGVSDTLPIRWNCPREILLCEVY